MFLALATASSTILVAIPILRVAGWTNIRSSLHVRASGGRP